MSNDNQKGRFISDKDKPRHEKAVKTLEQLMNLHKMQGEYIAQLANFLQPDLLDIDL